MLVCSSFIRLGFCGRDDIFSNYGNLVVFDALNKVAVLLLQVEFGLFPGWVDILSDFGSLDVLRRT